MDELLMQVFTAVGVIAVLTAIDVVFWGVYYGGQLKLWHLLPLSGFVVYLKCKGVPPQ